MVGACQKRGYIISSARQYVGVLQTFPSFNLISLPKIFLLMSTTLLTVTRRWQTKKSTISTFSSPMVDAGRSCASSVVSGYILEEKGPSTTERNQDRRIPAGTYSLKWHSSLRFGRFLPLLYSHQVPASRYILIHSGNHAGHTEGCLLVGSIKSQDHVGNSRLKLDELLTFLRGYQLDSGNFSLRIEERFE